MEQNQSVSAPEGSTSRQTTPNPHTGSDSVHEPEDGVDFSQRQIQTNQEMRVEDMPLDKKLEALRKYNPLDYYDDGRYIDAQDTVNQWCLGQIVAVDQRSLNIHFDGWSNRWDIWQKMTSYKIAPFRRNSKGYTGQNKVALRQLKFTLDELHTQKQRVEKLIDSDLTGLGAFETTQYFRGQLYIYVDFLLSGGPYTEEQIDAINDFIYSVLRLIVTWLKKLPSLLPLYSQIKVNPDLFLIDENIAIVQCAYEFLDMLKKIFCGCHRCFKYYLMSDKAPLQFEKPVTKLFDNVDFESLRVKDEEDIEVDEIKERIMFKKNIVFGQFMNFINYFAQLDGFTAIINVLRVGNDIEEKTQDTINLLPIEMISMIASCFKTCNYIFAETFSKQFVLSIRDVIVWRLANMTEKELKEIDKEIIGRVLNDLKDFFSISMNDQEVSELIEGNQLSIALRFLKSTYLEKRLKGISDIKHIIDRIEYTEKQAQMRSMSIDQRYMRSSIDHDMMGVKLKPLKWLNAEHLKNWILQQNVLEVVFGENTHTEIVKRSSSILKFLAKQQSLPIESIDLIWKCQMGKHEEMVRVVYNTIQELVQFIDIKSIDIFYSKIEQVPPVLYDDKFLDFLKEFTLRALENYYEFKNNEGSMSETEAISFEEVLKKREINAIDRIQDYISNQAEIENHDKQYGLPIFWDLIQDRGTLQNIGNANISKDTLQNGINSILNILKMNYSRPIKINYLIKSLENIFKGESISQSIIIAHSIIHDFPEYDFGIQAGLTRKKLIIELEKQLGLINQLVNKNIKLYHQQVKERLRQMVEKGGKQSIPQDASNFIFQGRHSHEITIQSILNFIEFIINQSGQEVCLGEPNIDQLWLLFVQQPNLTIEQSIFLKWLNQHREDSSRNEYFLLTNEERKYFFTKILCNPTYVDFQHISVGQVKCFHKYFKIINRQENNLNIFKRKMRVLSYDNLIGLDTLWRISIESENERTREESMDLLVDLHLKFDSEISTEEQIKIWTNFTENCMKNLDIENDQLVSNTLQLLSKFLDRYEGKRTLKFPEISRTNFSNCQPLNITVLNRSDNQKRTIQVSYFQTIGFLRQKIAEAFNMQINEFIMYLKSSIVEPEEDDDRFIKDVGIIHMITINKNPNYNPDNHPKYLISNNQINYEKLFQLLNKNNPKLVEIAWNLLQKLPLYEKLKSEIKELSGVMENKANWDKILDPKSTNKLLYSLNIIQNVIGINKKDQKVIQWRYKFLQMGGFNHMLKTFINLDIKTIETNLTMKCIQQLIFSLFDYITNEKDVSKTALENKELIINKCINLIDLITDYTIYQEKKRGESYEDIQKKLIINKLKKNKYKSYMVNNKDKQNQQNNNQEDEDDDSESSEHAQLQSIIKQIQEDSQTVSNLFKFMNLVIFSNEQSAVVNLALYPNLENFLLKSTIITENWLIRQEVLKMFKDYIIQQRQNKADLQKLANIVEAFLFKIQPLTEQYENRCNNFYEGISQMLDGLTFEEILSLGIKENCEHLINTLAFFIVNRDIKERNTQEQDSILGGKMKLLKSLLQKFPLLKNQIGQILADHLIHTCLFEVPQGGTTKSQIKAGSPKCKHFQTRQQACKLLAVLCRDCPQNLDKVLTYLSNFNHNPSWRTNKDHDWNISLTESEKSSTGFVGLKNLGCICYMNSLFQQLFMIQGLRNDILTVNDQSTVEKEENMLYQLQLLFAGLLKSEKQYVSPKGFCHAFKDWEGQPTNVLEQMDVEEFFNMLMDRIETAIKGSPQQNTIQHHFGGKFASEMICKGCPHKYERAEPFLSIQLPVKNKKSIQEGFASFIQGDMLEGDNAYFCEKCDKKVDTQKRTCLKRLPRYLIVALRRFEFDYDKMIRVKVNDYCEFPMDLDLEPYTQEGLARREKLQKMKEEKGEDNINEETDIDPLKYPKEYYEYSLSGVVVHSGTADSGHYYSFIKDREHTDTSKWYEMNDHIVRDFDPADIPQECFGGEENFQGYNMMNIKSMKWRNAYLLFYERKTPNQDFLSEDEAEKISSKNKEDLSMNTNDASEDVEMQATPEKTLSILQEIEQKIAYENQKYWQNRFLFGNEYLEFVYDISLNWNTSCIIPRKYLTKNNDFHIYGYQIPKEYECDQTVMEPLDVKMPLSNILSQENIVDLEERVFKFAAGFYITILQRAQNKNYLPQMINLLKGYINKNVNAAKWLISEFCNYQILEENFLQCGLKQMRKFTAGLLYCAMLKVYDHEKLILNDYWRDPQVPENNKSVLGNFILVLIHNLFHLKRYVGNFPQYFQLLARASTLGSESKEFMLRAKGIGRLMEFYFDDVSPHKDYFRDFSDINPQYKEKPDIGLPTQIDKKQMSQFQEIMERRRMKILQEQTPKYKYLIEAVGHLIKAFSNGEIRSPFQTDDVQFEALLQQERDLFIPDAKFLRKVFGDSKKARALSQICTGYIHYCWSDRDSFNELVQVIHYGLNDFDGEELKPYLILLQFMLQNPGGENPDQRFELLLTSFLDVVKQNQMFYRFMEIIFDFIFKITSKIPQVRQWFKIKKALWVWLIEWAEQSRFPSSMLDAQNNNIKLYKRRANAQFNQQYLRQEALKNTPVREVRMRRLELLLKDQQTDLSNEIDMDLVDMQDHKFTVGELIEYLNKKGSGDNYNLQYFTVDQVLDEMIGVKLSISNQQDGYQQQNQQKSQWFGCDSGKIFPQGTYKSQFRVKFLEFYQDQLERSRVQSGYNSQMRQDGDQEMGDGSGTGPMHYNQQNFGDSDDEENDSDQDDKNYK